MGLKTSVTSCRRMKELTPKRGSLIHVGTDIGGIIMECEVIGQVVVEDVEVHEVVEDEEVVEVKEVRMPESVNGVAEVEEVNVLCEVVEVEEVKVLIGVVVKVEIEKVVANSEEVKACVGDAEVKHAVVAEVVRVIVFSHISNM